MRVSPLPSPTAGASCGSRQPSQVTVYIKHLCLAPHASSGVRAKSRRDLAARRGVDSSSGSDHTTDSSLCRRTHTDTAVFSVINKKAEHETPPGWSASEKEKSLASKSSASGSFFFYRLSSCCFPSFGFVSGVEAALLMLTASYQQAEGKDVYYPKSVQ